MGDFDPVDPASWPSRESDIVRVNATPVDGVPGICGGCGGEGEQFVRIATANLSPQHLCLLCAGILVEQLDLALGFFGEGTR